MIEQRVQPIPDDDTPTGSGWQESEYSVSSEMPAVGVIVDRTGESYVSDAANQRAIAQAVVNAARQREPAPH